MNLSVSTLLRYLKSQLDNDSKLQNVVVSGEISNFHRHQSGHLYFSLKDDSATIACVMFRFAANRLAFNPKNGDKVLVQANTSIFEASGQLQLYVTAMRTDGIGDLFLRYEQLKKKLDAQGLFNNQYKKPKPNYVSKVAVLVGDKSAAMSDIKINFAQRWPFCQVDYYPVLVQGNQAPKDIIETLKKVDDMAYDAIILARGGGSFEDLFCFNDEELANCIFSLKTFIITGIGHEQDFTIADFVSDLRAPTPTGAVVMLTPDIHKELEKIANYHHRLSLLIKKKINTYRKDVDKLTHSRVFLTKNYLLLEKSMRLEYLKACLYNSVKERQKIASKVTLYQNALNQNIKRQIDDKYDILKYLKINATNHLKLKTNTFKSRLESLEALLEAYSYQNVLDRGYSIAIKDGKVIHSKNEINIDDEFDLLMKDGSIKVIYKEEI